MLTNGRIMPRTDTWLGYDRTNHKKKDVHRDAYRKPSLYELRRCVVRSPLAV